MTNVHRQGKLGAMKTDKFMRVSSDTHRKAVAVAKKTRYNLKVVADMAVDALWEETFRGKGRAE